VKISHSELCLLFVLSEDPSTLGSGVSVRIRRYLQYAARLGTTIAFYPARSDSSSGLSKSIPDSIEDWICRDRIDLRSVGTVRSKATFGAKLKMVIYRSFPDAACLPIHQLAAAVRKQCRIQAPTIVWFDMPATFPVRQRLGSLGGQTIGCCQDSSSLLLWDQAKTTSGILRYRTWMRRWIVQRAERALNKTFDRLVFLTKRDAEASIGKSGGSKVFVIPLAASSSCFALDIRPESTPLFVFIGAANYWPNADAIRWLCLELIPALRKRRSGVRVRLAGKGPWPPNLGENVAIMSNFENLAQAFEGAWAAVAPVRLGAGMQNKVIEAAASGVPLLVHDHALRGAEELSPFVWRFTDKDSFVEQAMDLLNSTANMRAKRAASARDVALRRYSPEAEETAFKRAILETLDNA